MDEWGQLGREKQLAAGAHIWHQSDPAGIGAYLVGGVLGVEKVSAAGERVVFTELKAGAILGEMSCLDGKPHSATVKALTNSTVRLFDRDEFDRFLQQDPDRIRYLLRRQNERLRFLTDKLLRVGTESVSRRLAYWLLEQSESTVFVTHHDLAAKLATTRESVSKGLGQLRKLKVLKSSRGKIEILDRKALAATLQA